MHLLLQRSIGVGGTLLNTRHVPEGIGFVMGFRLRHGGGEGGDSGEGSGEGGGRRLRPQVDAAAAAAAADAAAVVRLVKRLSVDTPKHTGFQYMLY